MKSRIVVLLLCCIAFSMQAAMPRWAKTGNDVRPMRWYHDNVTYFVDAGALSSYVSHDAAIAIVDAAARVWNVPSASLTVARGGTLSEDVNEENVYISTAGPIWPDDVQATNYDAKNIAVIFDTDGSITDMLLGAGASAPANCRSAAVTESVDRIDATGFLQHALLILNGRCTGPATEQQLQMQYQLMRAFGRVLGIGWSQTNDNVFTGSPAPTYSQQQNWPIMHPIDIICGAYTYQCVVNPFQLRPDDIAAIGIVYPVTGNPPPGKILTTQAGATSAGTLLFPNGMGMAGVNVVVHVDKSVIAQYDDFEAVSSVSGYLVRSSNGNPVTGSIPESQVNGTSIRSFAGQYLLSRIPLPDNIGLINLHITTQPLNPLYVGAYSVGPYRTSIVTPSGYSAEQIIVGIGRNSIARPLHYFNTQAIDCSSGEDGNEASPATVDAGGIWLGRFCGYGHTSWMTAQVKKGRSLTVEVTALDESGNASSNKALPLIGVWSASDATGTLPTIAATPASFNGRTVGLTRLPLSFSQDNRLRIAITEQRGEGRPDFNYRARILYADSVSPARIPETGGRIVIHGMGFQPGNVVTVGGLLATVESLTSTEIVATAPALASNLVPPYTADVAVTDLKTGGSTKISSALTYGGMLTDVLQQLSAPSGNVAANTVSSVPFAVRLVDSAGVPVRSAVVAFSVSKGEATFGCGVSPCSVQTDANGIAQTTVIAGNAGAVILLAKVSSGASVRAVFQSVLQAHTVTPLRAMQLVAAGENFPWQPQVMVRSNGSAADAMSVVWTTTEATFQAQNTKSDVNGIAAITYTKVLDAGQQIALTACAWGDTCATLRAKGIGAESWRLSPVSGDMQSIHASASFSKVVTRVVDSDGNAIAATPVTVYQRVEGWQPPCTQEGRCPVPPVYGSSTIQLVADADGLVSFRPLEYASTATRTHITVVAGTSAHLDFTLEKYP